MTNLEDTQPPAVGAYWINEGDYPAVLKIFPDGNKMPLTWKEWLKIAEEMERGLQGLRTCRPARSYRSEHISGLVRGPWHEPGCRRAEKVRRCSRSREVRRSEITDGSRASRRVSPSPLWVKSGCRAASHAELCNQLVLRIGAEAWTARHLNAAVDHRHGL